MGRAIERLLIDHGVDMYIAGHDHTLQFLGPHDDVRYVVSGGGGGDDNAHEVTWRSDTAFAATRGGFAAITLTAQEAYVHFVRSDGATQFGTRWGQSE
jgi:tartrate-resistant acid phosphatase type 5